MSVLIEAESIVLRNSTIAKKYKGGLAKYKQDTPYTTFCTDGHIARIGFMVSVDAARFVLNLEKQGFLYTEDDKCIDIAVVSASGEFWVPCDWLEFQRSPDGVAFCSLKGVDPGEIAVPSGWAQGSPGNWISTTADRENDEDRFQYLRRDGNVEVYLDKQSMKEVYVGRAFPGDPQVTAFADLLQMGVELVKPYIYVVGAEDEVLDINAPDARRKVEQGIDYLRMATISNPRNWPAYWFLGKIHQRLQDSAKAYSFFKSAFLINPDQADVCRELMCQCLELGKTEEGVSVAQKALKLCPDDPGLMANLGLALFLSARLAEAKQMALKSLEQDPTDQISKNLLAMINQVEKGKRKQPRRISDLSKRTAA